MTDFHPATDPDVEATACGDPIVVWQQAPSRAGTLDVFAARWERAGIFRESAASARVGQWLSVDDILRPGQVQQRGRLDAPEWLREGHAGTHAAYEAQPLEVSALREVVRIARDRGKPLLSDYA